jgi:hypothetical protein
MQHTPAFYRLTHQLFILLQDKNSLPESTEIDVFLPHDGSDLADGINNAK